MPLTYSESVILVITELEWLKVRWTSACRTYNFPYAELYCVLLAHSRGPRRCQGVSASLWCLQSSSNNHQLHPQLSQLLQAMSPQHGMLSFSSKLPQRSHHLYPQTKSNNSQWLCSHPQGKRFRDSAMDQRGDIESKSCLRQLPRPSRIRQAFPPATRRKPQGRKTDTLHDQVRPIPDLTAPASLIPHLTAPARPTLSQHLSQQVS
jgi:hypothetical protein